MWLVVCGYLHIIHTLLVNQILVNYNIHGKKTASIKIKTKQGEQYTTNTPQMLSNTDWTSEEVSCPVTMTTD